MRPDAGDAALHPHLAVALRVPAFVTVSLGLGLGTHVAAHGLLPSAGRMLFAAFAVAALCAGAHRREVSALRLTLTTGAVQAGLHVALSGAPAGHSGAAHGAVPLLPAPTMLLAHVLAALAVCWWLRRGEAAVWRAVRRLLPALPGVADVVVPQPFLPRPVTPATLRSPLDRALGALHRRGPPALRTV